MTQQLLDGIKAKAIATNHPECRPGEIFLTNTWGKFEEIGWQTKRLGRIAYDRDGKALSTGRPVFVKESEILKDPG